MLSSSKNLLVIYVKQPILGKVKTRLAKSVGDEKALAIYQFLLQHLSIIIKNVNADIQIHYAGESFEVKGFEDYSKIKQIDADLGNRMYHSIDIGLNQGYKNVILIGSDFYDINAQILNSAFEKLNDSDTVIGKAKDGGYYLIGMKKSNIHLFENMKWSNDQVYVETIKRIKSQNLSFQNVSEIIDIDTIEDLPLALKQKFDIRT